tara:strand:+ start:149 stop:394 length:246 start_codon:yes stop_codon:yes gene_type:complete
MAITQTKAQGRGIGQVHPASSGGFNYVMIGSIWFIVGGGAPASADAKDAPKGSMYIDTTNGLLYVKNTASGTVGGWVEQKA